MTLDHDLEQAKQLLQAGGVVALPTETVYGLAASIDNEDGLKKIFAIKERPFFDPLIVHISDLEQRTRVIASWPEAADWLARKFWPGPLTFVLPKHSKVNPLITSGLDTVGIRMPAHPIAKALIEKTGPLAAPSANKFGKTSPTKADHVRRSFHKEDIFILDGGQAEVGLESTVIAISGDSQQKVEVTILRPGAVTQEMLESALHEWGKPFTVQRKSSMASPGNVEHHYMPNIPLVILEQDETVLKQSTKELICNDFQLERNSRGAELRLDANPKLAARALYTRMRECTEGGASFIYVFRRSDQSGGLWEAIWDRLSRASSRRYPSAAS